MESAWALKNGHCATMLCASEPISEDSAKHPFRIHDPILVFCVVLAFALARDSTVYPNTFYSREVWNMVCHTEGRT
jgi:hypothetical protein